MSKEELEKISGYVQSISFHNEANNYNVIKVKLDQKKDEKVTVVGYFEIPTKHELCNFYGNYKDHPRFGRQFILESYEKVLPSGEEATIRYLSSPLFPKIGIKTAQKIVDCLGKDVLTKIKEDPLVLEQVEIKQEYKQTIIDRLSKTSHLDDAIALFVGHGLNLKYLLKIYAIYNEKMIDIINQNPYRLIIDIEGIGFKTADRIALSMGFELSDNKRLKAALVFSATEICYKSQNTYTNKNDLYSYFMRLVEKNFEIEELETLLEQAIDENLLILENEQIFPYSLYEAEKEIADIIYPFMKRTISAKDQDEINEIIHSIELQSGIIYSKEQNEAIHMALSSGVSIITGGPGTGKTTVVNAILKTYQKLYPDNVITLCAPTGRASKRMSEISGYTATTIHRILKWDLETNRFKINEENPLTGDFLIIDEFSMVDCQLFSSLLKGCIRYKQILIIGDDQQLPPVMPGDALRDLMETKLFNISQLIKIHRQGDDSGIIPLAYDIREGRLNKENLKKSDVVFKECNPYQVKEYIVYYAQKALESGYNQKEIQVLAPMYDGVCGINNLNYVLRDLFNPASVIKKEIQIGTAIFREGDKIIQLKNQPDDDIYNGDIGIIEEIVKDENGNKELIINFDENYVTYKSEYFTNISHAYCISVHKSQGSEYSIVMMPFVNEHSNMLRKKLIYTGITRTKKSLILLGELNVFDKGVTREEFRVRKTSLTKRIKEKFAIINYEIM